MLHCIQIIMNTCEVMMQAKRYIDLTYRQTTKNSQILVLVLILHSIWHDLLFVLQM